MFKQIQIKGVQVPSTSMLAAQAVALGLVHHGHYKVLPIRGTLSAPIEKNGWLAIPRKMDDSYIPREADKQVQLLKENGFKVVQQIVIHEPEGPPKEPMIDIEQLKKAGNLLLNIAGLICRLIFTMATGIGYLFAFTIAVDPALVCVLEDGTWLVVAVWRS